MLTMKNFFALNLATWSTDAFHCILCLFIFFPQDVGPQGADTGTGDLVQ